MKKYKRYSSDFKRELIAQIVEDLKRYGLISTTDDLYMSKISALQKRTTDFGDGFMRFEAYTPQNDDYLKFAYLDSISVTDLWTVTYNEQDASEGLKVDNDGDGSVEYILAMYNEDIPTDIDIDYTSAVVSGYELYQNYPNPFNPTTTITFYLPQPSDIRLIITNIIGKEIKIVAEGNFEAGMHNIQFNASDLASGIYFYRMQTDHLSLLKKCVFIR